MAATNFTPIILYHTTTASAAPTAGNLNNGELAININDGKLFYKDSGGTVQVIATKGTGTIGGSNTQVQYNSSGALAGSANFTFNGTTATINTLNLTNALGTAYGGTALTTYTQGDLVYASAANTLAKLGIGANTYILTSTGSVPQWSAPSAITVSTATNLAGGAAGSVPYQSGASTTTFLSIGSAGQVLTSSGTAPQWSNLSSLGVTSLSFGTTGLTPSTATQGAITVAGTLATTNGGTGLTSFTANGVLYASSSSALATGSALTFDGTGALSLANTGNVIATIQSTSTGGTRSATLRLNVASTGGDDPAGTIAFTYDAGFTQAAAIEVTHTSPLMKFVLGSTERVRINSTGNFETRPAANGHAVFNEDGVDADFRVESDTNTHAIFLDAASSEVGINVSDPLAPLHVFNGSTNAVALQLSGGSAYTAGTGPKLVFQNGLAGGEQMAGIQGSFDQAANGNYGRLSLFTRTSDALGIEEKVRIGSDGAFTTLPSANGLAVFNSAQVDADFVVRSVGNSAMLYVDAGNSRVGIGLASPASTLDVNGTANTTQGYTIGGDKYIYQGNQYTGSLAAADIVVAPATNGKFVVWASGTGQVLNANATGELVINEGSYDYDFRVESDASTHMLFVDAGNNRVGVNQSSPSYGLDVNTEARFAKQITGGYDMGFGATVNWAKIFVVDWYNFSNFQFNSHHLDIIGGGDTNGYGVFARLFINTKQQGTSKLFDIQVLEQNGCLFAYKYDATGGTQGAGRLEIWMRPQDFYQTVRMLVLSTLPADDIFSGQFPATDTGTSTQPSGSTVLTPRSQLGSPITTHSGANSTDVTAVLTTGSFSTGSYLKFPATQVTSSDANALDDYEEGTFTPVVNAAGVSGVTYAVRSGRYQKVGNRVTVDFLVELSSKGTGGSGNLQLEGLPFTIANLSGYYVNYGILVDALNSDCKQVAAQTIPNQTYMIITKNGGGTVQHSAMQYADITNTTIIRFSGSYEVA